MTTVLIDLSVPGATGNVPAIGNVLFRPTVRYVEDDGFVLPEAGSVTLVGGLAEVELEPTGAGWAWEIIEAVQTRSKRYVTVPESATPILYTELPEVDGSTLIPTPAPQSWWVALGLLQVEVDSIVAGEIPQEVIEQAVADYLAANPIEGVTQADLDAAIDAIELTPGPANVLSVGTVTTGAAGSQASVTITGTAPTQTINFTIPRGATGTSGTNGTNGTNGTDGIDGASAYEIAVTNGFVGTEQQWLASLVGPKGDPGEDGTGGGGSGLLNAVMVAGDSNVNSANDYGGEYMFHEQLALWLGGVDCVSAGIGGATTPQVAASIGAAPVSVFLADNQIPATGRVAATFEPANAIKTWQNLQTGTIDGIHGRWYEDAGDRFGRTTPGDAHPVLPGTNFIPDWAGVAAGRAGVIWTGNNDGNGASTATVAVRYLKAMSRKFGGRVIILTPKPGHLSQTSAYIDHENQYAAEFGPLVLNVRTFLNQYGLIWAGLTPTADDTLDIEAGKIPRSLFHTDGVHLNDIGEGVLARKVAQMLLAAGFVTLGPDPLPDGTEPPPVDTTAPIAPTGLDDTAVSANSVTLAWTAPEAGLTYRVRQDGVVIDTWFSGATRTISGLAATTPYLFAVQARDASGNVGPFSADLEVTTSDVPAEGYDINTEAATIIDLDASTLSANPITAWAPARGLEAAALTANGTPDLLTAATPSGSKAVRFARGGTAEYASVDWPVNYSTPSTMIAVVRFTVVDAYVSAGLTSSSPFAAIYYDNTNVIRTQVSAAGTNIGPGPALNEWAVLVFVYDGSGSRQYLNSTTPFTVSMATGAIHTGITVGSNGSKTTPGGVDIARLIAVNRALTASEAQDTVTALKTQYGIV